MIIDFFELILLSYFAELGQDFFAKLSSFFGELLLHIEQVPIGPDARKHIIEKLIKFISQRISDLYDLVSQCDLVPSQIFLNLVLDHLLSEFDILERFLNFFFQRSFEIQFVDRVEWDHRMEQMVCV